MSDKPLYILGAGAMGRLYASYLAKTAPVTLITRQTQASLSWSFIDIEGEAHQVKLTTKQAKNTESISRLLVTVKAYQVKEALASVRHALNPDAEIILLHNGMGVWEEVKNLLPSQTVLYASSTHGALRENENVKHTGLGVTYLASLQGATSSNFFADICQTSFPPVQWSEDFSALCWDKLAINCVINPLAGIHQCRNGELLQSAYREQIRLLCCELAEVKQAEGLNQSSLALEERVLAVMAATAENYCSTNRDLHFRRRTEIDYINAYVLARAKYHGLELPENEKLYKQIKLLETQF